MYRCSVRFETGPSRRSADRTEPGVGRQHSNGGLQIVDFIAVVHSESAQREASKPRILALFVTLKRWLKKHFFVFSPIGGAFGLEVNGR